MDQHILIRKKNFNPVYFSYLNYMTPLQIFYGGASSGKSVFLAQRCVLDIVRHKRNYLIVRNVANTIRSSAFNEIKKVIRKFKLSRYFTINKSEMLITCKLNNRQIIFKGLDDIEKLKSITPEAGVLTDIWIEEATEVSEPSFNQLQFRLRGGSELLQKRITLSFNPISRKHWIRRRFFPEWFEGGMYNENDVLILHTTHKDNDFLTKQDHKVIESYKHISQFYYDVYALGKWGVLGDLIFTNWAVQDLSEIKHKFSTYYNGLDFGFTNDPTALARASMKGSIIYITEELYEKGLKNPDIARKIRPIVAKERVTCDSSAPKDIAELKDEGITAIGAVKGKGSVLFGIQWLQQYHIIVDKKCQNAINELSLYQWKKDKHGDAINDPVDKDNHIIDALRYAFEHVMEPLKPSLITSDDIAEESKHAVGKIDSAVQRVYNRCGYVDVTQVISEMRYLVSPDDVIDSLASMNYVESEMEGRYLKPETDGVVISL